MMKKKEFYLKKLREKCDSKVQFQTEKYLS